MGRNLDASEYVGPLIAWPARYITGDDGISKFVVGNCARDGYSQTVISARSLNFYRTAPPLNMDVLIPYNGVLRTRFVPYGGGSPPPQRARSLSYQSSVFDDDIYYDVVNVSASGAGNYKGIPMYFVRNQRGFLKYQENTDKDYSLRFTGSHLVAAGAVRIEGEETTGEDIYQIKDFNEPYLTVADITTNTADNCSGPLYAFADPTSLYNQAEMMLAYNGKGDRPDNASLTYAHICSIGGIKLSFAGIACIDQPTYSSSTDLVITAMTIRKKQVTHA